MDSQSNNIPITNLGPRTDYGFRSLAKTWGDFNRGEGQFNITEDEWYTAFKCYGGLPDFDKILGGNEFEQWMMVGQPPSDSTVEKIREIIKSASNKPEEKKPIEQVEEVKKKELPKINAEVAGESATATATEEKPEEELIPDPPEPKTEEINETVLGMIGLEPGVEISYQKLFDRIERKLASAALVGERLPEEEDSLLRYELKKIQKLKNTEGETIRIKIKATKVKTRTDNLPDPGEQQQYEEGPTSSAIVRYKKPNYNIVPIRVEEQKEEDKNILCEIKDLLDSILETLQGKFKFETKQIEGERKQKEQKQRGLKESLLEGVGKGVGGLIAITEKAISPFQSILDKIWNFITYTLLGKAFTMFTDWMSDKDNRRKFDSFVDFLVKHWPALAGIYILFGTSFGKLVRGLLKTIVKMGVALLKNIPRIAAFIRNNKAAAALATLAVVASAAYIGKEVKDIFENSGESPEGAKIPTTPGSNPDLSAAQSSANQLAKTKTIPKIPTANLGGLIPKMPRFSSGAMNPYMGGDLNQGIPIKGAGPDDTLAAVRTGEAILTQKDQTDIGNRYVDRNTGQPLNIPQYLSGRKPGMVSMNKIQPRFGGYYRGGVIQKFSSGGLVNTYNPSYGISNSLQDNNLNLNINPNINSNATINPNINSNSILNRFQSGGLINPNINIAQNTSNSGGKPKYGSNLKYRSPIPGYPNYQTPADTYGQFFAKIYNLAKKYGDPFPEVVAAQAVEESNFGRSVLAKEANNLFGQDAPSNAPAERKYEYFDPVEKRKHIAYKFPSIEESVRYRVQTWRNYYGNARVPSEAVRNIASAGYNPHSTYPGTIISRMREYGIDPSIPSPIQISPPKNKPQQQGSWTDWFNMLNPMNWIKTNKKQGGGSLIDITNKTGIRVPGAADTQYLPSDGVTVQPGEQIFKYVLTRDAARMGAGQFLLSVANNLNSLDRDSDQAARFGRPSANLNRRITPYNSSGGGMITLPPINLGSGNMGAKGGKQGSVVPSFSAAAPDSDREINAKVYYGIV